MEKANDFLYDAKNVYRTKNYIVKQVIGVRLSDEENNIIISFDTYYRRTSTVQTVPCSRFGRAKNNRTTA